MIRLRCIKCGMDWYTANTISKGSCTSCGGVLMKIPIDTPYNYECNPPLKPENKVIYLNQLAKYH